MKLLAGFSSVALALNAENGPHLAEQLELAGEWKTGQKGILYLGMKLPHDLASLVVMQDEDAPGFGNVVIKAKPKQEVAPARRSSLLQSGGKWPRYGESQSLYPIRSSGSGSSRSSQMFSIPLRGRKEEQMPESQSPVGSLLQRKGAQRGDVNDLPSGSYITIPLDGSFLQEKDPFEYGDSGSTGQTITIPLDSEFLQQGESGAANLNVGPSTDFSETMEVALPQACEVFGVIQSKHRLVMVCPPAKQGHALVDAGNKPHHMRQVKLFKSDGSPIMVASKAEKKKQKLKPKVEAKHFKKAHRRRPVANDDNAVFTHTEHERAPHKHRGQRVVRRTRKH